MIRGLLLLLLISSASNVRSQQREPTPVIENGYVTRTTSLADFDVNGFHVIPSKKTMFLAPVNLHENQTTKADPYLGQVVTIYGDLKKSKHQVIAERVLFPATDSTALSGFAIVDRIVLPAGPATVPLRLLVRADGYVILIDATTKTDFASPLASIPDIKANVWIQYHGKTQPGGFILADTATFSQNTVPDSEAKLLDRSEYDPSAVDPDSKQNIARWLVLGIDPKKIPPYRDVAMQARIDRIGSSLIPAYQQSLPDSDPVKIRFTFQLIDATNWNDAYTLPNGIMLIPFELIERLQNDTQIATLLADNIARALEKQAYRLQPGRKQMAIGEIAGVVGGLYTFGAATVATANVAAADKRNSEYQSGRVSLGLLHDAGYDITQAPITWWLLSNRSAHDTSSIPIPSRASNLYKSLGTTWHNYSEASTAPTPTLQTK
jgi:hypothetical protein